MYSKAWPRYPRIYEVNTWVWLADLGEKYGRLLDLGSVPTAEWDSIAAYGFDAVWLMGVWERSPAGVAISNQDASLVEQFREALPDFQPCDNVGSPYSIRRYAVSEHLGGTRGLAGARKELARRGIRLILDFVPNHVAPDHPWAASHPEYFIRSRSGQPGYSPVNGQWMACGRDPYSAPWADVLQLNAFDPGVRRALRQTLADIAFQCDGVRCEKAMLVQNSIFARTWGNLAGLRPDAEFWADLIPAIKRNFPDFLFIADVAWGREWDLELQGFDYCCDNSLYARLGYGSADAVRLHLRAALRRQHKLLRFIETHEHPRVAGASTPQKTRALAMLMATVPGARLFHEGQFEGRKVNLPVYLGRRPAEPVDRDLKHFYGTLLNALDGPVFEESRWALCEVSGCPGDTSFCNVVAWTWLKAGHRCIVAVNLSGDSARFRVRLPSEADEDYWVSTDPFSRATYIGADGYGQKAGLDIELAPWGFHFLQSHRRHQRSWAGAA